jgi:hypothetical protein
LTHFSARYVSSGNPCDVEEMQRIVEMAAVEAPASSVTAAHDFLSVKVPIHREPDDGQQPL